MSARFCHPPAALRLRRGHKRGFGESLHHVPRHSSDRFHAQKGGRVATERDEFLRAAWRVMVSLGRSTPSGWCSWMKWERTPPPRAFVRLLAQRRACAPGGPAQPRQEHHAFGLDDSWWDGRDDGRCLRALRTKKFSSPT